MKSHPLAWIAAATMAITLPASEPTAADTPSSSLDRRQQRALEAAQKRREAEQAVKAPVVAEPTKASTEKARTPKKAKRKPAPKQS